ALPSRCTIPSLRRRQNRSSSAILLGLLCGVSSESVTSLPPTVATTAQQLVGAVLSLEPQAGLSGRVVVVIRGERGSVVARSNPAPVEVEMAGDLGAALRDAGVRTPSVRGVVQTD